MTGKKRVREVLDQAFQTPRIKSMTDMAKTQGGTINNIVFRMMHEQTKLPVGEVITYLEEKGMDMSNIKTMYNAKISV